MIKAVFYQKKGLYCGFIVTGHAGGKYGQDIVCAGVSSAVMFVINTLSDFLPCECDVKIENNIAALKLNDYEKNNDSRAHIFSLKTHLRLLAEDYGGIKIVTRSI